jgi:peptide/nickel transport system permease protein
MVAGVVRRILLMFVVLAASTFLSFVFFWTHELALKGQPVLPAYWRWVRGLFDGSSYTGLFRGPLWPLFWPAIGHTAALLVYTFILVIPLTIGVAALAASRRNGPVDYLLRGASYVAWAVPAFLLALVLALAAVSVGGQKGLGPFAIAGFPGSCPPGLGLNAGVLGHCPSAGSGPTYVWNLVRYLTIPALTLAVGFVGLHARYLRAGLLQTLDAPFITTARAKGLPERRVVTRHAMRISVAPFIGALFADFGAIFGAALAVDWVFKLNGIGTLFVRQFPLDSYSPLDVYSIQLCLLITGGLVLLSALLSDTLLTALDPRLRKAA